MKSFPTAAAALLTFGLIAAVTVPLPAGAQVRATAPIVTATPFGVPSPQAQLPPASSATALPYPAFGSPVPGIGAGTPPPNVPQVINLAQAVNIAVANAPVLASARADVGIAAAQSRLAASPLNPAISLGGSAAFSHSQTGGAAAGAGSGTGGTGAGGTGTGSTSAVSAGAFGNPVNRFTNSVNVSLRQLIYDGGQTRNAILSADLNETAFADAYRRSLQTLAFNVASAYYTQLNDQRQTAAAIASLDAALANLNLTTAQVRAGTAARSATATFENQVALARLKVVQAQGKELTDQAAFANALGIDANANVLPADDISLSATGSGAATVALASYATALQRAYLLRPDLASAQRTVQANEANLRAKRLGRSPTLSGSAGPQITSSDTNGGSFRNAQSVGLTLTIPIFDQGITAANSAVAAAQLDKANAQLTTTRQRVQLDVKQALVGLVTSRSSLDQAQVEFTAALTNLRATQAQYRAGVTTIPALVQAQQQYTQALVDQVNAAYGLRTAEQTYLYALGANVTQMLPAAGETPYPPPPPASGAPQPAVVSPGPVVPLR